MEINEEDWDLVNDDGFIYWRPKRQPLDSTATATATATATTSVQPPDPAAEAKARSERKKKTLLKLKTKYQQEIHHWELLSNSLKTLQDRTQNQPPPVVLPVSDQTVLAGVPEKSSDSSHRELTDNLLAQVEAQEATISEISKSCDVAEALCEAEEQRLSQPFIDLPIWEPSPKELITSLLKE